MHYSRKEGNVLFNDALSPFYLRLYGYMVKDYSDSKKRNLSLLHRLLLRAAKDILYAPSRRRDTIHHGLCYTSCRALVGKVVAQWVHHEGSVR